MPPENRETKSLISPLVREPSRKLSFLGFPLLHRHIDYYAMYWRSSNTPPGCLGTISDSSGEVVNASAALDPPWPPPRLTPLTLQGFWSQGRNTEIDACMQALMKTNVTSVPVKCTLTTGSQHPGARFTLHSFSLTRPTFWFPFYRRSVLGLIHDLDALLSLSEP